MSKLITHIKRLALALCLATPVVSWAAVAYTGTDYEPWLYSQGCVVWRGGAIFHSAQVADVSTDGTIGDPYTLGTSGHPWQVFASNQGVYSAPGTTLVYDETGYTASSDAQFAPLSFGGLWVKALQAEGVPYSITDTKTDTSDRKVELGAANNATYFKFDESFEFDRNSAVEVKGSATVEIADSKIFTINKRANKGAKVDSGNTLILTGANTGTLKVVAGLTVGGTLDLSAATRPMIDGDVTLSAGSTIVLPAGTTTPFTVCSGTLSAVGVIYVKVGSGDAEKSVISIDGGTITAIATTVTYTATIDGETAFSAIEWTSGGEAATITSMDIAVLEISGSGVVTGLDEAPVKVTLDSGVTLDVTALSAADFASIEKGTAGTYRWTSDYPAAVPYGYTYEYVGGSTAAEAVTVSGNLAVGGTLKTSGFINISDYQATYTTSALDVVSGTTRLNCGDQRILGSLTVRADAILVNERTSDAISYSGYATAVNVYGTVDMGNTRWSLKNVTINMYGGTITGAGQETNGALDFIDSASSIRGHVTSTISASIKFRNELTPVVVNADQTITLSGVIRKQNTGGGVRKQGAGTLTFTTSPDIPGGILHDDGHLVFNTGNDVTLTVAYNTAAKNTRSLWYSTQSNWKGTVKVTDLTGNVSWLTGAGNANSTIALANVTNAYIMAAGNTTYTLPGKLRIDGETIFNNGSSGSTVNITELTGTGDLTLVGWGGCSSARYNLNKVGDYSGTLTVHNGIDRGAGGTLTIGIGDIITENTAPDTCVLPITSTAIENPTGTVAYNLDNAKLNGESANLVFNAEGEDGSGIYVDAPDVARVGETKYKTVADAAAVAWNAGQVITLLADAEFTFASEDVGKRPLKIALNGFTCNFTLPGDTYALQTVEGAEYNQYSVIVVAARVGDDVYGTVYAALTDVVQKKMPVGTVVTVVDSTYDPNSDTDVAFLVYYFRWRSIARTFTRIATVEGVGETTVEAATKTEAENAVTIIPTDKDVVAALNGRNYSEFFTKTAEETSEGSGVWTVTAELNKAVVFGAAIFPYTADTSVAVTDTVVLDGVLDDTEDTVVIPARPGLYYSFKSGDDVTAMMEGDRKLANGESVELDKVDGDTFYQVLVNTADK